MYFSPFNFFFNNWKILLDFLSKDIVIMVDINLLQYLNYNFLLGGILNGKRILLLYLSKKTQVKEAKVVLSKKIYQFLNPLIKYMTLLKILTFFSLAVYFRLISIMKQVHQFDFDPFVLLEVWFLESYVNDFFELVGFGISLAV